MSKQAVALTIWTFGKVVVNLSLVATGITILAAFFGASIWYVFGAIWAFAACVVLTSKFYSLAGIAAIEESIRRVERQYS